MASEFPSVQILNPLTSEDEEVLHNVLDRTKQVGELIAKAKDCGIPVDEHESRNEMHRALAEGLLEKFFPVKPMPTAME